MLMVDPLTRYNIINGVSVSKSMASVLSIRAVLSYATSKYEHQL